MHKQKNLKGVNFEGTEIKKKNKNLCVGELVDLEAKF